MSEISLFSSTAEISEDTFRALFEIIAKYSRLGAKCRRRGAMSFWGEIQLRSALIT